MNSILNKVFAIITREKGFVASQDLNISTLGVLNQNDIRLEIKELI
jgi:hypothetical protein